MLLFEEFSIATTNDAKESMITKLSKIVIGITPFHVGVSRPPF
nr:hypothetical protein [Bacillus pinisoli]